MKSAGEHKRKHFKKNASTSRQASASPHQFYGVRFPAAALYQHLWSDPSGSS